MNLVDLTELDVEWVIDLPYTTTNNFMKRVLYTDTRALLHKEPAEALVRVARSLRPQNLFLKIWDGYRPMSVQQEMWDAVQDERYISNPAVNKGRHTRGTAVDLTLVDTKGKELEMPTAFDAFIPEAAADATTGLSQKAIDNRTLLQKAMLAHGFILLPSEWWHFDYQGWEDDERFPAG